MVHIVIFFVLIKEYLFLVVFLEIFARRNQKSRSPAGGVYVPTDFDTKRKALSRANAAEKGLK